MSSTAGQTFASRLDDQIVRLANDRAALARLRRSMSRPPGEAPEAWPYIVPLVDEGHLRFGLIAAVLGLFALHQQGQMRPMHRHEDTAKPMTVGTALAVLRARRPEAAPGIERRFVAAVASDSVAQLALQLRGLVTLLRNEAIPLDYVQLEADFRRWLRPESRARVRRRWGLDFFSAPRTEDESAVSQTATTEGS